MTRLARILALLILALPAAARAQDFASCLSGLEDLARQKGLARTFAAVENTLTADTAILRLLDVQPEFSRQPWDYINGIVSENRISAGRAKLAANKAMFDAVERRFGVDRHIVAAIWGMETNYGTGKGDKSVLRSTATLACYGRRTEFFTEEFLSALEIVARGDIPADSFRGSWAGAFGHTQFMPSTFRRHAVDGDGDGHRNLIASAVDALSSTANYLKAEGWAAGQTWGYEIKLPPGFDYMLIDKNRSLRVSEWARKGITRVNGQPFPRQSDEAFLLLPGGAKGPAFLLLPNFRAILKYNTSDSYALAVGHLADRLRGGGAFVQSWPTGIKALSLKERVEVQNRLTQLGFDIGHPDGKFGQKTRDAVKQFQQRAGLLPDGFVTHAVLARLRQGS